MTPLITRSKFSITRGDGVERVIHGLPRAHIPMRVLTALSPRFFQTMHEVLVEKLGAEFSEDREGRKVYTFR